MDEDRQKAKPIAELLKELPIVDAELLTAFHAAKGVEDISCHRCGNKNWFIHSSDVGPATGLPTASDDSRVNVELFTPVLTLSCSNCGTVWMIALHAISEWLAQNKNKTERKL